MRIHYVKHIPQGYVGMNLPAAMVHGIPFPFPPDDIVILKGLPERTRQNTIRHEINELKMMSKGFSYSVAHKIALKYEDKR